MSGGAFSEATIFALSIQPYINASIIIQLLAIAIPALERLQKDEGEDGKKKLESITRYSTVFIGLLQGFAYYMVITLKDSSRSLDKLKANIEANAFRPAPKWLEYDANNMIAKVVAVPAREDIDLPVEEHLIVELYSK